MAYFSPCRVRMGYCTTQPRNDASFHVWQRAISFAAGQCGGIGIKHRIYFDGKHWIATEIACRWPRASAQRG